MRKINRIIMGLCMILVISAQAAPAGVALYSAMPQGTYSQSCSSCYVDSNNTLQCSCADRFGIPRNTALPDVRYCRSVENINGQLQCSKWQRKHFHNHSHRYGRQYANIEAGPIWSQNDAQQKCPSVCQSNRGNWTGQWNTTVYGQMSVCQCQFY